jgi:hypothetical protein
MDTITTDLDNTVNPGAERAGNEALNVETVTSIPFLSGNCRWAIRFNADKTVTIVLGARDYGRGWFSAYFAGLAATRLGIPFQRFRLYYNANHPAALQTPLPSSFVLRRGDIGPFASAIADVIEAMCDQVIEKGRLTFAAMAGIGIADVGFDQAVGRFFVLEVNRSRTVMEVAVANHRGRYALAPSDIAQPGDGGMLSDVSAQTFGRCNE